jgi:lipopolysaccharide cholinephosphotransferase
MHKSTLLDITEIFFTLIIFNYMKTIGIKEMQKIELEILKRFSQFCDEHKLRYFLSNGTLLGAIRHKGFIPWDDDIDVYMPRNDYMTFLQLVGSSIGQHYKLITPYNSKKYLHTYAKLYDDRTILIEYPETARYTIGVYIDIFPVDGLPDSELEIKKHFIRTRKLIHKNWLFIFQGKRYMENTKLHKRTYGYIIVFFAWLLGKKFYFNKLDKLARKFDFDKSDQVALTACGYGIVEKIKKSSFAVYQKVEFENNFFNAPIGYHEYLTSLYGNYMKLPPKDEQVKRHKNETYWK